MSLFQRTPEAQVAFDKLIEEDGQEGPYEAMLADMTPEQLEMYAKRCNGQLDGLNGGTDCMAADPIELVLRAWPDVSDTTPVHLGGLGVRENLRQQLISLLPKELRDQYQ